METKAKKLNCLLPYWGPNRFSLGQISELLRLIKESYCNFKLKCSDTGQHTVLFWECTVTDLCFLNKVAVRTNWDCKHFYLPEEWTHLFYMLWNWHCPTDLSNRSEFNSSNSSSMISLLGSQLRMMTPSVLLIIKWFPSSPLPSPTPIPFPSHPPARFPPKKKNANFFPGLLGCWNKKHGGGSDLHWIIAHTKKVNIGQAVMSILRRTWAKYQQLLTTHPWKTQTIGTGIVINEIPFLTWFVMKLMIDLRRHHLTQIIWVRWCLLKIQSLIAVK